MAVRTVIVVEWSGYLSDEELDAAERHQRYRKEAREREDRLARLCKVAGVSHEFGRGVRLASGVGAWEMVCDDVPDAEIVAFLRGLL